MSGVPIVCFFVAMLLWCCCGAAVVVMSPFATNLPEQKIYIEKYILKNIFVRRRWREWRRKRRGRGRGRGKSRPTLNSRWYSYSIE
ncbi:hypothetical protein BC939DRAFT_453446 [Gamsiella multidivaricata]|uniref:uncharacterized protein n=1 Tax=Gamsiella multidivaricata TaxID=101098 RepID=UPI0022205C2A|nr:uncharacterized protein BC939DRAFT_453446 [Gamsiella multidivaricata]KAI7822723.1 hypothetical protein BC939DRAFT_453446 [Gamsiella multidivaricata]